MCYQLLQLDSLPVAPLLHACGRSQLSLWQHAEASTLTAVCSASRTSRALWQQRHLKTTLSGLQSVSSSLSSSTQQVRLSNHVWLVCFVRATEDEQRSLRCVHQAHSDQVGKTSA